jgi:hypothetical protein
LALLIGFREVDSATIAPQRMAEHTLPAVATRTKRREERELEWTKMNSETSRRRLRAWAAVSCMFTLVACGGGSGSAAETPTPPPPPPPPAVATLSVSTSGSGQVVSSPSGISCSNQCSGSFDVGASVTLTAQAAPDFQFDGWSDACSGGNATCTVTLAKALSVKANFVPLVPVAGAPFVQFTDALSGPITGGENNQGSYLSIFGANFGSQAGLGTSTKVFIGDVEVANYRYLGPAKVAAKMGLQQLTVQVGNLGLALGTAEPVKVVVGGKASNANNTFTPNPGRIWFVALDGDDKAAGDVDHPMRHLQTPSNGGVAGVIQAGDHVVIRGGNWSDLGFDTAWFRFRYPQQEGTAPTGKAKSGWIHFTAYPGPVRGNAIEDVHYSTPAESKGGFQGANSAYFGTTGDYISISNLRLDVDARASTDAAPINLQYSAGPWRVVNNELGPWPAAIHSLAAGVSGHGDGTTVLGNHIHDIACTGALENHGIYADSGASNWRIGFNWIHDITGGNLIQFFDNVGLAGAHMENFPENWPGFTGMSVFNNWLENAGKYGLNLADGIVSGQVWNNVVKGVTYSGLRINTISKNMDLTVAFNTFYDNDRVESGSGNGQVLNTWGNYDPSGTIRIYDNIFAAGPHTLKGSDYYVNKGDSDAYLDFRRNLWWDNGYGWSRFGRDAQAVLADPKFVSAVNGNLALTAGSPAVDAGTQPLPAAIREDFTGTVARPSGAANDLGAFELVP